MALISALRKNQVKDPEKLAAFVAGIARNVINNFLRQEARRPKEEPLPLDLELAVASSESQDHEHDKTIQLALRELGDDDRQLVTMILVEGLKPRQIAAKLGLTAEVVRTRKLRALRRLSDLVRQMSRN